jgi:hypothetical protein
MLVGNIHLVEGGEAQLEALIDALEEEGMKVRGSADAHVRSYAQFGIDEARELRERAWGKGREGARLFIVAAPFMTAEAQNALLKTLEEPPGDARFFFLVAAPSALLPTLRSRMQSYALTGARAASPDAAAFLASAPAARLLMLKPYLEKGEDDTRDLAGMLMLLSSLEGMLADRVEEPAAREGIVAVYRARSFLADKGALVKPLLEQVALLCPKIPA